MATKNTTRNGHASQMSNKPSNIMVTLPLATRKKIEALAEKEQRSMAHICRQFIEQGLNNKKLTGK